MVGCSVIRLSLKGGKFSGSCDQWRHVGVRGGLHGSAYSAQRRVESCSVICPSAAKR